MRLGISPNSPKLRILASSASLEPSDPKSLRFLTEFFGTQWKSEQIIPGVAQPVPKSPGMALASEPFVGLGRAVALGDHASVANASEQVARSLGSDPAGKSPERALHEALEAERSGISARMLNACLRGEQLRAVPISSFAERIFSPSLSKAESVESVRGLLVARSLCDKFARSSLPSFRLHWFFRNIEGLWACTMPGCQCRENEMGERTAGKLFGGNRILCGNTVDAHRVLELLYCEQCGTTFFGGSRLALPANSGWELLSTDPDIEGIPDRQAARFVDRRNYDEFAVSGPLEATHFTATPIVGGSPPFQLTPQFPLVGPVRHCRLLAGS